MTGSITPSIHLIDRVQYIFIFFQLIKQKWATRRKCYNCIKIYRAAGGGSGGGGVHLFADWALEVKTLALPPPSVVVGSIKIHQHCQILYVTAIHSTVEKEGKSWDSLPSSDISSFFSMPITFAIRFFFYFSAWISFRKYLTTSTAHQPHARKRVY